MYFSSLLTTIILGTSSVVLAQTTMLPGVPDKPITMVVQTYANSTSCGVSPKLVFGNGCHPRELPASSSIQVLALRGVHGYPEPDCKGTPVEILKTQGCVATEVELVSWEGW
jgi:hypothetical protein